MAIENRVALPDGRDLYNFSVSFNSVAGDQASYRTVPDGKLWELVSLRATHTEPGPVNVGFLVTDGATDVAYLTNGPDGLPAITTTIGWTGSLFVPEGWRIYAQFRGMAGGYSDNNWQYIVYEEDMVSGGPPEDTPP